MRNRVCVVWLGLLGAAVAGGCSGKRAVADGATNNDVGGGDVSVDGGASESGGDVAATPSPLGFDPSNINHHVLAWNGVQDVTIAAACRVLSELGRIECGSTVIAAKVTYQRQIQIGAGAVGVFVMKSLRIEPGASLQVVGNIPVVLVAAERMDILGSINGSATKADAIAGGFSAFKWNPYGAGPGGGAPGAPGYYGGGGASHCGLGGAGAADVTDMPAFVGAHAGAKYGSAEIIPLTGGSSGGGTARDATGGGGGGAIQLVAGVEIAIGDTGVVAVSGGGARPGGGGSGGAVLLESPKVTATGTLAANGGGGGIFAGGAGGQDGPASTTGAAGETVATAGGGSAAMALDGIAGLSTSANNTSGGGGGAGRFRINTTDGTAMIGTRFSPSAGTACVTQGMLKPLTAPGAPSGDPPAVAIGFKPSVVDQTALAALAAMPTDDMVLTNRCLVDTDMGKITCGNSQPLPTRFAFAQMGQASAGMRGVIYARSLRVEPGAELEVRGKLPLLFAAPGAIVVHGAISGRAVGGEGWAGGSSATNANGTGLGGGNPGAGTYHGGSGGGYCGEGGIGASPNGEPTALGGRTTGSPAVLPFVGGSSGGGNGTDAGGAGGGAIHLVSGTSIDLGAGSLIDVAGGGRSPRAGGGSGGTILLEAPAVSLRGVLAANGGGGGDFAGGPGGDDGRSAAEPAFGELPNTGGKGSAGDMKNGEAGVSVTPNATSGGGGAAGRIRVNTANGQVTGMGVASPSAASGCFTLGMTTP